MNVRRRDWSTSRSKSRRVASNDQRMPSAESTRVPSRSNKSTDGRVRAGDGGGATSIQATGGGPPADRYPGNSALFFIDKTATSAAVTRWTVNGLASTAPPPLPLVVRGL